MAQKKIIAVVGATGAQGGGLVRAILAAPAGEVSTSHACETEVSPTQATCTEATCTEATVTGCTLTEATPTKPTFKEASPHPPSRRWPATRHMLR